MNLETKVGLFVFFSLMVASAAIIKISDIRFDKRYTLYFVFKDVKGLQNKSPIKIAGVEIGRVDNILLEDGRAKVIGKIQFGVPVYSNGKVKVKQTGLIGSQYLDLEPGTVDQSQLKEGDTLYGSAGKSLDDVMEKLSELIDGKEGQAGLGDNLIATMANLRSITDSINRAIGQRDSELQEMVLNLHQFTADLKGVASDLHDLTSSKKEDIQVAITKMRSLLERLDDIVSKVQKGEGSVGKLLADKEMGEDVKKTVANFKDTSASAKEVLARFTKVKSFWEFEIRSAPGVSIVRGDGGIKLQPRDHKYYYLGVNNAGDRKDEYKYSGDYEKKNTITAVLGKEFGSLTVELGAIRSSAGIGLKYFPFQSRSSDSAPQKWTEHVEFNAQAFDFSRDETRGLVNYERKFKGPHFNLGAAYHLNRWVQLGATLEDIAEVKQVNLRSRVVFEDRDLAYLFGFVSFVR